MINGLAIWHYPHRTPIENVIFFADNGFSSVSMQGKKMYKVCEDETSAAHLAAIVKERNLVLTVHYKMPETHSSEDVKDFEKFIDGMAKWQKTYGLISVLSFDVPQNIRDNVLPYLRYVLKYEQFSKIAVEDFGLTEDERKQIEPLKADKRFGYLVDIGHLYIRLRGECVDKMTQFENSPHECPVTKNPGYDDFMRAFASKEFPIFEVHLHNNDGADDTHLFFEDGTLDMQIISDVLRDIKFDGIATIESAPGYKFECKYPESDERILQTFRQWKKLCETE